MQLFSVVLNLWGFFFLVNKYISLYRQYSQKVWTNENLDRMLKIGCANIGLTANLEI